MPDIAANIAEIKRRMEAAALACSRPPGEVGLVAVSKTVPAERVRLAVEAGVATLGENYIQEARAKIAKLADLPVSWHFIGRLQSNKAKFAVPLFDLIHSVDSVKLAREIDKQAAKLGKRQRVLIQVNTGREDSKTGVFVEEARRLVLEVAGMANLALEGLMTLPPFFDQPEKARPFFHDLCALRDRLRAEPGLALPLATLSMGMTGDFEAAIAEGATLVRIGTAIFGARP